MRQNAPCEGRCDCDPARLLASQGRHGDTLVAHISPLEAAILRLLGGSGTTNPRTGLPEFWGLGGGVSSGGHGDAGDGSGGGGSVGRGGKTTGGTNDGSGGSGRGSMSGTAGSGMRGTGTQSGAAGGRQASTGTGEKGVGITGVHGPMDKIGSEANIGQGKSGFSSPAGYGSVSGESQSWLDRNFGWLGDILGSTYSGASYGSYASPFTGGLSTLAGGLAGLGYGILDAAGAFDKQKGTTGGMGKTGQSSGGGNIGGMGGGRGDSGSNRMPAIDHATVAENAQQANAGGGLLAPLNPVPPSTAPTSPTLPIGLLQYLAQNPGLLQGLTANTRFGTGTVAPVRYGQPYA